MATIGFIGTGTIGGPIAARIVANAHSVRVFDIDPHATATLVDAGAAQAASVADVAAQCETVFLSLPGPKQIEDVVLGESGLLAAASKAGAALETIIDLSTNAIALNRRIAKTAADQGIHYLDAPVSGGKIAAQDGSLAVMVGGDENAFQGVRPLIECFGKHLFYLGPAGAGTMAKLVNNQIFLASTVLVQEGFVMGAKAGMDPSALLEVLKVSSAGSVVASAPLVLSRKFDLDVFALAIAAKDIDVALESADELGTDMPMTKAAAEVYHEALRRDLGSEDFYATIKVLETAADTEVPKLRRK